MVLSNDQYLSNSLEYVYKPEIGQRRKYSKLINDLFQSIEENEIGSAFVQLLSTRTSKNASHISKILNIENEADRESIIRSHVHMHMNRFFRTNQRTSELLVYDFLGRFLVSQNARMKNKLSIGKLSISKS